eukprot:224317-Pyramimonas_sp.AAC.1
MSNTLAANICLASLRKPSELSEEELMNDEGSSLYTEAEQKELRLRDPAFSMTDLIPKKESFKSLKLQLQVPHDDSDSDSSMEVMDAAIEELARVTRKQIRKGGLFRVGTHAFHTHTHIDCPSHIDDNHARFGGVRLGQSIAVAERKFRMQKLIQTTGATLKCVGLLLPALLTLQCGKSRNLLRSVRRATLS